MSGTIMTLEQLADFNLVDSLRAYARWQSPNELVERDGLMLMAGPTRFPASFMNAAIRTDSAMPAVDAVRRAREFFGERARNFTFVTRARCDGDLKDQLTLQGFDSDPDAPCMLVDRPLPGRPLPDGIRVSKLQSVDQIADVVRIGADAYRDMGLSETQAAAAFSNARGLFDGSVTGVLAYLDDTPASMALAIHSRESSGVYWVGTTRVARGKGLAEICTRLATNEGFARGARVVTLQASEFGEPIYRRMGFREYDRQGRYRQASGAR